MILDILVKQAKEKGACALINGAHTPQEFAELYFSPQGMEFCIKHNFPNVGLWRELKNLHLREYGIYCDAGEIKCEHFQKYGIIGETNANLMFNGNYEGKAGIVILQHGAKATIIGCNYAVIRVEMDNSCKIDFKNIDGTSILLK